MATVNDSWFVTRRLSDGSTSKVRSSRHGTGKRWQVRWRDERGRFRKKSFERKVDADRMATEVRAELTRGTYIDPDAGAIKFHDYAERWRAAQFSDSGTTYQVGIRFRRHVYPVLGHLPLRSITPTMIRQWSNGLRIARSYQRTIFANVSQVFTAAVADDILGKNPCRSATVRKPVADPRSVTPWSGTRVAGVRSSLPERYSVLVTLAAGTGLRQGEVFGLSPEDIDGERALIHVRRQIKLTAADEPYFALPKGRKIRSVPLPETVRGALLHHLASFPARTVILPWDRPDGDLISVPLLMTTRESGPVNRHYFNARIWKPALIAAGVPPTRDNGCHALRHYYASALLEGGESIKVVSERLGHADPAFTLRTYTHLIPAGESRTRFIMDNALREASSPPPRPSCATDVPRPPRGSLSALLSMFQRPVLRRVNRTGH